MDSNKMNSVIKKHHHILRNNHHDFTFLVSLGIVFLLNIFPTNSAEFTGKDVTPLLFGAGDKSNEEIFPLAFGDFNADKLTDVFAVSRNYTGPEFHRTSLLIYLAREEEPLLKLSFRYDILVHGPNHTQLPVNIVGISPGDFNGDGLMDVVITYENIGVHDKLSVLVCRGDLKELNCEDPPIPNNGDFVQEPLVIDVNGDMVMDLVGERWVTDSRNNNNARKQKSLWVFEHGVSIISSKPFDFDVQVSANYPDHYNLSKVQMTNPSSVAIVDVDGDTVPELVIITQDQEDHSHPYSFIEYYRIGTETNSTHWNFILYKIVALNEKKDKKIVDIQVIGQSLFLDLNQDGKLRHLLPYCQDLTCETSGFKIITINDEKDGRDIVTDVEIQPDKDGNDMSKWSFLHLIEPHLLEIHEFYGKALTFRAGDYNMDGFPDLIGVLMAHQGGEAQKDFKAVIFENVPCVNSTNRKEPCPQPRSFRLNIESLSAYTNVAMATFYDIFEDGLLDVMLVRKSRNDSVELMGSKKHKRTHYGTYAFLSNPDYDANFLKVMVTTGKNCPRCPLAGIPYGNIIPGPVIKYFTSTQEGDEVKSIGAQMYRSSNIPLDLPYVFFGIGHSPNFIETLDVSVSPSPSRITSRKWTQLIPNSQIIILPYSDGKNNVGNWKAKIFLPSSKAALHTFGVLLGFCALVFLIVAFLHWKERREDHKERLLESHRFHMM